MPNLVTELNSLDFSNYIGGPMQAAVQAQTAASLAQVNFIEQVGFVPGTGTAPSTIRYVDFEFNKKKPNPAFDPDDNNSTEEQFIDEKVALKVPFLTMLTIPALRIDEMTIDFNAKLTSTQTANVSSEFNASAEFGVNYKVVNFKTSASYRRSSSRSTEINKTYTMGVQVKAVNDELPAGLDRLLGILEDSITSDSQDSAAA